MTEVRVSTGPSIEYETFGSPEDPAMVLIAGLGSQLLSWDEKLCRLLVDEGFYVVRFDNRDCGLSTIFDDHVFDSAAVMAALSDSGPTAARELVPYTLTDMAADVVGLMDAVGLERSHIVGASMGGWIAQLTALRHPDRTISLTSMMSSTREPEFGQSTPEAETALFGPSAANRAEYIANALRNHRIWGSRRYQDPKRMAALAAESFDRSFNPAGTARHVAAIMATGPWAGELRHLHVPTLVIHGRDDTLIAPSGGERTAELIPGAHLLMLPDMGHDRPEPLWPDLSEAIGGHAREAQGEGR
jgi:pimeloyl-ACP methyl ester carboxylesterase